MRTTALAFIFALHASVALAAPKKPASPSPDIAGLEADDTDTVRESIESLGLEGTRAAAAAITARLTRGMSRELTLVALDALGILQHAGAAEVVAGLTRHRDATIRLRAIQTLTALEAKGTRAVLERGLDDSSPAVRAECARALARFGDRGSLVALERAFERGELGAAVAIATLGDEVAIRRLVSAIGRVPFEAMVEPLTRLLGRTDLDKRVRLDTVGKLVELATPEVKYFFEDLAPNLPGSANDPVKRAVEDAAFRIVD